MTAEELYQALDKLGVEYDVAEVFEGLRVINFVVDDTTNEFNVVVQEIARVALERDYRHVIGHELDLSDEEMEIIYKKLERKLNDE